MTVFEALKAVSGYPVPDDTVNAICIERELDPSGEFLPFVALGREYNLARADIYAWVSKAPSLSQGGISFNLMDDAAERFRLLADGIYAKYGVGARSGVSYGFKGTKL